MSEERPLNSDAASLALRVEGLSKTYPGTRALTGVSLAVRRGTIYALVGSNGSGKSTLVKSLAGIVQPDRGQIVVDGERVPVTQMSAGRARELGLRFAHQHSSLFPDLTVAENLALGHGFVCGAGRRIRWRQQRRRAREVLERFHIEASPDASVRTLGPARQAMLVIARTLQDQEGERRGLLVLDEPTAGLPGPEVDLLLSMLRRYAGLGQTILFVSHRLNEVLEIADETAILRDGKLVQTLPRAELSENRLIEGIVGRALDRMYPAPSRGSRRDVLMKVDDLSGGPLKKVTLRLHRGEIIGLAGLQGCGRSTLLETIFGIHRPAEGRVQVDSAVLMPGDPASAMAAGIALVPADRAADSLFPELSVLENLGLADVFRYWQGLRMRHRQERVDGVELQRRFQVRASSLGEPISALSGGNQQKVVLARWLRRDPRVLLLDEPTQGIDVAARTEIYRFIRQAIDRGAGALVASSDFGELAGICDRVLVVVKGSIATELSSDQLSEDRLEELTLSTKVAV